MPRILIVACAARSPPHNDDCDPFPNISGHPWSRWTRGKKKKPTKSSTTLSNVSD